MTFYKEGKKFTYPEVVNALSIMIKENMISQLETDELCNLYIRFYHFAQETIINTLTSLGYSLVNMKQAINTLVQLKVITNSKEWQRAIQIAEDINTKCILNEKICIFMENELLNVMKDMNMVSKKGRLS